MSKTFTLFFLLFIFSLTIKAQPPGGGGGADDCEDGNNCDEPTPLDEGVIFLIIAGMLLGYKKFKSIEKSSNLFN